VIDRAFGAFRLAWRDIVRRPTTALTSVVLLALGIGANLALYASLRIFYLRPPSGVVRPSDIYVPEVWNQRRGSSSPVSREEVRALRTACGACSDVEGYTSPVPIVVTFGEERERVSVQFVTDGYFDALGARTVLGQLPRGRSDGAAAHQTWIVLSHKWWTTRFGSDAQIIGRTARVGALVGRVAAVVPDEFVGLLRGVPVQAWGPERDYSAMRNEPGPPVDDVRDRFLIPFVRSARREVSAELNAGLQLLMRARIDAGYAEPGELQARVHGAAPGLAELKSRGGLTPIALGFAFTIAIVVLTCANLAQMAIARTVQRQHQIAVQVAMGASAMRVTLPLIAEHALVAFAGTAAGLFTSWWVLSAVMRVNGLADVRTAPDLFTVAAALLMAILTTGIVSAVPAWRAARTAPIAVLRKTSGIGGVWSVRSRRALVGVQVMLAALLLAGAAAFTRSAQRLEATPLGFVPSPNVLVAGFDAGSEYASMYSIGQTWERLALALADGNDLRFVALIERLPNDPPTPTQFTVRIPGGGDEVITSSRLAVSGDYFGALQIPVLAGALLPASALPNGELVAVVSETFARRIGGISKALGAFVQEGIAGGPSSRVIGVVRDVRPPGSSSTAWPLVYVRASHTPSLAPAARIVATSTDGRGGQQLESTVRRAFGRVAPSGVVFDQRSLSAYVDASLSSYRAAAVLMSAFGMISLMIAAAGCYGTASFVAAHRTREAGIRAALGASKLTLLKELMSEGALTAVGATMSGLIVAAVVVRLLATQFQGLADVEWTVFAGVGCVTVLIAVVSALGPNWAAASRQPANALRAD
jgi:predicted permease